VTREDQQRKPSAAAGWDHAFAGERGAHGLSSEPAFGGALSFFRRRYSKNLAGVDVAVTGVPLDTATSNRPGARFGPRGIRAASAGLSWARPWPWDFDPFARLSVIDYGDCQFPHSDPPRIPAAIESHISDIIAGGAATLVLGGDHYVTYPVLKAYTKRYGKLRLIHFDAHSDTWSETSENVDHGTMFYHAVREGLIDDQHSVQIGLRSTNDDTLAFNILDARWIHAHGPAAVAHEVKRIVGDGRAYLTFDIDCLDPAYAPGTGTPVCGGLTTHQAQEIVRGLAGINLVGMDLMEVAPAYDVGEITALAGASLAVEFLCVHAANPRRTS
jgi:agmatinase